MKIFIGKIPENPCEKCNRKEIDDYGCVNVLSCVDLPLYVGQQSILDRCVEIDLDEMYDKFKLYYAGELQHILDGCCPNRKLPTFEKFIKEQVKEKI